MFYLQDTSSCCRSLAAWVEYQTPKVVLSNGLFDTVPSYKPKKPPHYPIMLCNPVKFIKPQFPTNINSLLKVLVLVFTRGLPSRDSPHPKPIFFGPILIQIFSFCVSEPDPINIYPMRIKHVSATWN